MSLPERVQSQMSMRESFGNYKRTSVGRSLVSLYEMGLYQTDGVLESSRFREVRDIYLPGSWWLMHGGSRMTLVDYGVV